MNSPRFGVWLLAALLLAVACDGDSERRLTPPPVDYLPNDSPDNLVLNVVKAWETMDAAGYAALLYDGVLEADDGEVYAPFKFYYDRSLDPSLPEIDLYDLELQRTATMLGGEPGLGVPGIKDITLDLTANGLWQTVAGGVVDDDPCPENAQWLDFETDWLLTLKANIGDTYINAWRVEDRVRFHCLPVQVGEALEWRLWKWRDILTLRTEDASFSQIRALY